MVAHQAHDLKVEVRFLSPSKFNGIAKQVRQCFLMTCTGGSSPSTMSKIIYYLADVVQFGRTTSCDFGSRGVQFPPSA